MGLLNHLKSKLSGVPTLEELIEDIPNQMEKSFGQCGTVFHEVVSDDLHIDVYTIEANPRSPHHVLFTTGMSMKKMPGSAPQGVSRLCELMIFLPSDWVLDYAKFDDDRVYWPISMLKWMARVPHEMGFVLREHISIPFDDPPRPVGGTDFGGWLVVRPDFLPPETERIRVRSGLEVQMYALLPMTMSEMAWKALQPTGSAFREMLDQRGLNLRDFLIIRPGRESLI